MYQCSTHGWVSMYTACPQCQPHIVSTATTDTMHQSSHTPEQRGVDVYRDGKILVNYVISEAFGTAELFDEEYLLIGQHSFKDGEDVTGRYELGYQLYSEKKIWCSVDKEDFDIELDTNKPKRIVAIPLPSKGQEGEAERKANFFQEYLESRIKELNQADNDFCKDRWDMSKPDYARNLAREMSNQVTFARQELEQALTNYLTTTPAQ